MVYEREMSKFFDATSRHMTYELGPSRPPSEATSLLIRLVRGCPWHRCSFCSSHRTKAFSLRSVEEVKRDIETAKKVHDKIKELSWQLGERGNDRKIAALVYSDPPNENFRNVALWLYHGAQTCFLQDADSLVLKTPQLVEIIRFLKETFPSITRVTSYARSKTASKKKLEEFIGLHEVGLSRLHIGFESGSDEVLEFVEKGVSASEHITAGKRIVESGISLCLYLMPGLGGRHKSNIHMEESAKAINEINPHYIRLRSLMLREDLPIYEKYISGEFEPQSDDEVVEEIGKLVEKLTVHSNLKSDHIENLLEEVEGQLPQDKERILQVIHRYLSLPDEERCIFTLGRRMGYYGRLDELSNPFKREKIESILNELRSKGEDLEKVLFYLKRRFLV